VETQIEIPGSLKKEKSNATILLSAFVFGSDRVSR